MEVKSMYVQKYRLHTLGLTSFEKNSDANDTHSWWSHLIYGEIQSQDLVNVSSANLKTE